MISNGRINFEILDTYLICLECHICALFEKV